VCRHKEKTRRTQAVGKSTFLAAFHLYRNRALRYVLAAAAYWQRREKSKVLATSAAENFMVLVDTGSVLWFAGCNQSIVHDDL
jgi:hypothetical protein